MPEAAPRVIRLVDGTPQVSADGWVRVDSAAQWREQSERLRAHPPAGHAGLLLPLELALAHPERLAGPVAAGVWLSAAEDPARAVPLFGSIVLIGVEFPKFTDGRGYSTAVLLRTRLGWRGEMRALGDVLQDQLYAMRRVGFDSFALRADCDPVAALRGFDVFSGSYQGSVDQPLPAFRRAQVPA
jgi:uncharacterized protein (DUF934 family)